MLQRIKSILSLRTEERWPTLLAFLCFVVLNAMNVSAYWQAFSRISDNYHKLFVRLYTVSGFDPLTYEVLSQWFPAYQIQRHPLLAFFMWPLYWVNQQLMALTGLNWATVLTAMVIVLCATYGFVFLFRILRCVIGVGHGQATLLSVMYFSFAYVMLPSFAPDHFIMSQACLLLTLWLAGEKLKRGRALNWWQTIALFALTAGVSLNNGLKVFLAAMVTRRRRFFRPRFLLVAVLLPAMAMWGVAQWEYRTWQWPKEHARAQVRHKKEVAATERLRQQVLDTISTYDSLAVEQTVQTIRRQRAEAREKKKLQRIKQGTPLEKQGFLAWTDMTTSRTRVAVHNLFGEGIQLHTDHALGDVLRSRPVFVEYAMPWAIANYTVEALLLLLFCWGLWLGRRSVFVWTAMSFFLMDMMLHMGLGFGINEVYIMSAHYLFVFPIAFAVLLRHTEAHPRLHRGLTALMSLLTLWLLVWNVSVVAGFFMS